MAAEKQHQVVVQIPDLGLSEKQMASLKESFKGQLVSTMGEKSVVTPRIIIVEIRVVRQEV